MNKKGKEGGWGLIFLILTASIIIATLWNSFPLFKENAHAILNPTAGKLLEWNLNYGMIAIVFLITLIMTFVQKYATDQATLKELKDEQKKIQEETKKFKDHPEKLLELQKKQMEFFPIMMKHSMRPIIYTGIPIVLFFRWFMDVFTEMGNPKFFGIFSWFWFYLILSIIFSIILRKVFKVH